MNDPTQLLAKTTLFGGLDAPILADIAKQLREVSYASGALILSTNDPGNTMYIVREGRVRISALTAEGRQISFRHVEPGQIFGEIAVLDGGPRSASATALTAVRALSLTRPQFEILADRHPSIARAALRSDLSSAVVDIASTSPTSSSSLSASTASAIWRLRPPKMRSQLSW